jgi:hypothetical protein
MYRFLTYSILQKLLFGEEWKADRLIYGVISQKGWCLKSKD